MDENFGKNKILIVDDEENLRDLMKKIASKLFKNVLLAENGKEAAEIIKKEKDIDVVLSDIRMPYVDGFMFFEYAKKLLPNTPFVLVTGFIEKENAINALTKGVSDYIEKPFKREVLLECLQKAIEKRILTLDEDSIKQL